MRSFDRAFYSLELRHSSGPARQGRARASGMAENVFLGPAAEIERNPGRQE
jgi:hypothetical protein